MRHLERGVVVSENVGKVEIRSLTIRWMSLIDVFSKRHFLRSFVIVFYKVVNDQNHRPVSYRN